MLIFVDSILAMDVAIAEFLTPLRYTMIKPLYLLTFLIGTLDLSSAVFGDYYRKTYSVETSSNSTESGETEFQRSTESSNLITLVIRLQICSFSIGVLMLGLLSGALLIARYKFTQVLKLRLEFKKSRSTFGLALSRQPTKHDHSKTKDGATDDNVKESGLPSMPSVKELTAGGGDSSHDLGIKSDGKDVLKRKHTDSNPAKERMVASIRSAIVILDALLIPSLGNLIACLILAILTQIFPSTYVLYFLTLAGDWGLICVGTLIGFLFVLVSNWRKLVNMIHVSHHNIVTVAHIEVPERYAE
ncbi:hypothetical protein HDU97_010253 [Phlyctochytrium planicorne]|nr:hypothetical protein HDU97_010253 [Phlyctochytrium planicorne]